MSDQVMNQSRSDRQLREDCVRIYTAMGMDLNTAFRMFMERTRLVNGLPFPATLPKSSVRMSTSEAKQIIADIRSEAADLPEMSLDEINSIVSEVRAERKKKS